MRRQKSLFARNAYGVMFIANKRKIKQRKASEEVRRLSEMTRHSWACVCVSIITTNIDPRLYLK